MADGSCRWRQTGSEIKVIALRVRPPGCSNQAQAPKSSWEQVHGNKGRKEGNHTCSSCLELIRWSIVVIIIS